MINVFRLCSSLAFSAPPMFFKSKHPLFSSSAHTMESLKYVMVIFISLFFLSNYPNTLLLVHSQLLPIVDEHGGNTTDVHEIFIVHVAKPKGTRFLTFRDRKNWYMSFLPNTSLSSGERRLIYAYRHVISGFAARLTPEELEDMKSMDGFVSAYPNAIYEGQTTHTPQFLGLSGWGGTGFWSKYNNMGEGRIIGVIDSGIKPNHPSFNDNGMPPKPPKFLGHCYFGRPYCNNKLIGAVGFKNGYGYSPLDDNGHGTHVASTAAGNFVQNAEVLGHASGTASGTAPRAHLAIYKCLYDNGRGGTSGTSADILAAIERAISDKVDVLSMSLGSVKVPFYQSSVVVGSFSAMASGIFPSSCAMNEGPTPSIIANDAPWMLTVGASTTDRKIMAAVRLGNGVELPGESTYQPATFDSSKQLPIAYPYYQLNTQQALNCDMDLRTFNIKGKIVLCAKQHPKNDIGNAQRGHNVRRGGGEAMIVMNVADLGDWTDPQLHVLPATNVGNRVATEILSYLQNTSNPTATIVFKGTELGIGPAPAVATFSSRGPSLHNGGIIKPDIIAPGVNILAAWPRDISPTPSPTKTSTFNFESGTSMATPHVSGIVALLQNEHPNWSSAAIRSAIMTTSYTLDRDGNRITDQYNNGRNSPASVFVRGAGHIDPLAAVDPGLVYDLNIYDYLGYLCGMNFQPWQISSIVRGYNADCTRIQPILPDELNYPSFIVHLGNGRQSAVIRRTVTNMGDPNSVYTVSVYEPRGVRVDVNPQQLLFSQIGQSLSFETKFSLTGTPVIPGQYSQGELVWDSGKYYVRSPIAISFI